MCVVFAGNRRKVEAFLGIEVELEDFDEFGDFMFDVVISVCLEGNGSISLVPITVPFDSSFVTAVRASEVD